MKAQTRIDYAERIDRVVARVARSVGAADMPSVAALAGIAALSPFHFHRIFRLMTGESPGAMLRRIRLARSLATLGDADARITDASGEAGYATSQAYARAIRAVTGASASDARDTPEALHAVSRQLAGAGAIGIAPLAIEVISAAPLRLQVHRNVGAYAELNRGYERLFERIFAAHPMSALRGVHGVFDDDPRGVAAAELRFTCGIELARGSDATGPMLAIHGGRHLRARHVGDYDALLDTIDAVTAVAIATGVGLADAPLRVHYIDLPDDVPTENLRSDIYLPLTSG